MPKVKVAVEKIRVGDQVCTPGDRVVKMICGTVTKIDRRKGGVTFSSPDWANESAKKYGDGLGYYIARNGEKLIVKR